MDALIVYIFCYDICFYFIHRLLHTKHLYFIHKIHHKKYKPEYYDFYTVHLLEIPIQSIGLILSVYLYKLYLYQLICAIIFINVRGILTHDERFVNIIGNHHLQHHKYIVYNYGEYWLDYLFGTDISNKRKLLENN
jgi:sterol desaturase/sphingolipid hydroxylase (fatty acid hydroxylase superfamily)